MENQLRTESVDINLPNHFVLVRLHRLKSLKYKHHLVCIKEATVPTGPQILSSEFQVISHHKLFSGKRRTKKQSGTNPPESSRSSTLVQFVPKQLTMEEEVIVLTLMSLALLNN